MNEKWSSKCQILNKFDIMRFLFVIFLLLKLPDQEIKSINTAKKYLGQMEKLGIMVPKKVGKEIIYLNIDLFKLLSET